MVCHTQRTGKGQMDGTVVWNAEIGKTAGKGALKCAFLLSSEWSGLQCRLSCSPICEYQKLWWGNLHHSAVPPGSETYAAANGDRHLPPSQPNRLQVRASLRQQTDAADDTVAAALEQLRGAAPTGGGGGAATHGRGERWSRPAAATSGHAGSDVSGGVAPAMQRAAAAAHGSAGGAGEFGWHRGGGCATMEPHGWEVGWEPPPATIAGSPMRICLHAFPLWPHPTYSHSSAAPPPLPGEPQDSRQHRRRAAGGRKL